MSKIEVDQQEYDMMVRGNDAAHRVFGWLVGVRAYLIPPWLIVDEEQRIRNQSRAELLRELEVEFHRHSK